MVFIDAFDKDKLITTDVTKKKIKLTAEKLVTALATLKQESHDALGVSKRHYSGNHNNVAVVLNKIDLSVTDCC